MSINRQALHFTFLDFWHRKVLIYLLKFPFFLFHLFVVVVWRSDTTIPSRSNFDGFLVFLAKRISKRGSVLKVKGRLLQLQIQALQKTECGYKNSSSEFIMAKPLKWGILRLCTLIFQYDIHKNALKMNIIEIIILTSFCRLWLY